MTLDERDAINKRIDMMIGSFEEQRIIVQSMRLSDRIESNEKYRQMRDKLFKIAEKYGEKELAQTMISTGRTNTGVTAKGKRFVWEGNNGFANRSRYCGSLYIDGIGTVFTSGTIAKVVEYIINN